AHPNRHSRSRFVVTLARPEHAGGLRGVRKDRRIRSHCVPTRPLFTHIWGQLCGLPPRSPWTDRASTVENPCRTRGQMALRERHPRAGVTAHVRAHPRLHIETRPLTSADPIHPHCAQDLPLLMGFSL